MALVLSSILKSDIHAVIQFLTLENVPGHEIYRRLCAVYKNLNVVMKSTVNYWMKSFKERRTSIKNEACSGHLPESMNDETVAIVRTLLQENQQQTVHEIEQQIVALYP